MESINIFVLHEPLLPHSTVILQQIHISCYGYKIDTSHHPTPPKKKPLKIAATRNSTQSKLQQWNSNYIFSSFQLKNNYTSLIMTTHVKHILL